MDKADCVMGFVSVIVLQAFTTKPRYLLPFLQPGRLVEVSKYCVVAGVCVGDFLSHCSLFDGFYIAFGKK